MNTDKLDALFDKNPSLYQLNRLVALVLDSPDTAPVYKDGNIITEVRLGVLLANATTVDNFGTIMKYVIKLRMDTHILYVRDVVAALPTLATSPEFVKWASTTGAELLK